MANFSVYWTCREISNSGSTTNSSIQIIKVCDMIIYKYSIQSIVSNYYIVNLSVKKIH